jgi:hypothetical protein
MNDKRLIELPGNASLRDSVAGLALAPHWGGRDRNVSDQAGSWT